jgi:protein phosphatase 1 regulatory subunit 11
MQRQRDATSGSQIATATHTPTNTGSDADEHVAGSSRNANEVGVLTLRGGPLRRQRVVWDEAVVDNEHLGRKSSKSTSSKSFPVRGTYGRPFVADV